MGSAFVQLGARFKQRERARKSSVEHEAEGVYHQLIRQTDHVGDGNLTGNRGSGGRTGAGRAWLRAESSRRKPRDSLPTAARWRLWARDPGW